MTEQEKAQQLDQELNNKFAKFDDLMLGERETVAREDNDGGGSGGGYGDGSGLYEDGEQAEDPLQTAMAEESGQSSEVFGKAERPGDSVSFKPPGDVGSGHDDDIIARQLREAAEKEQDPELRAKLWDEYRKYKKGSS